MFDSTALLGLIRPFRLLSGDRNTRSFWLGRAAELLADWVLIVALFVAIYAITTDVAVVALFMLLRVLPRAIVALCYPSRAARISGDGLFFLSLPRIPLIASLALIETRWDLVWAGAAVCAYGLLTALSNESRAAALPYLVSRPQLVDVIQLNAAIERVTFVGGPLLAALVLWGWDFDVALLISAALLLVTSLLLRRQTPAAYVDAQTIADPDHAQPEDSAWHMVRHQPAMLLLAGGLFTGAMLAICLKVMLVEVAAGPLDRSDETFGLLLALVGVGTLLGPLSVPRLLGHLPVSLIVTGSATGIAAGIVLISVVTRLEIVALVLLGIGVISITNDLVTATATRRIAPEASLPGAGRLMLAAVIGGQLVAAVAIALLARVWESTDLMLVLAIACALAMTVLFVVADGMALLSRRFARA